MDFILNTAVSILLCLAIAYCWKLNNKIQELQNGREELANFIKNLDSSLRNANSGISELKTMTDKTIIEMSSHVKQSEELYEDLSFLIERAKNLSNKLEKGIKEASKASRKSTTRTSSKIGVAKRKKAGDLRKKKITKNQ